MGKFFSTLKILRHLKPDWGVAMNPSPHEVALQYLAGTSLISSFVYPGAMGKAFLALTRLITTVEYKPGTYVPRQFLRLLEPLGIVDSDTSKHLVVSDHAIAKMRERILASGVDLSKPLVVIAPTAGQTYKEWAPERFAAVALYVHRQHGASIALVGGPGDHAVGSAVIAGLENIPVYNGIGDSIEDMMATLSFARLIIAGDTGTIYIAEAFGASTLVIIGVTDPVEHPQNDKLHRVVVPPTQEFVLHSIVSNHDTVDVPRALAHLDRISVGMVTRELDDLWRVLVS